jgi:hypothetical protein
MGFEECLHATYLMGRKVVEDEVNLPILGLAHRDIVNQSGAVEVRAERLGRDTTRSRPAR